MTAELLQRPSGRHKPGTLPPAPSPSPGSTRGTAEIQLFSFGRQLFRDQLEEFRISQILLKTIVDWHKTSLGIK